MVALYFEQLLQSVAEWSRCIITGRDESVKEEEKEEEEEDEYLNLLYDPCLNCYFDPKTGKYYELAWRESKLINQKLLTVHEWLHHISEA